MDFRQNVMGGQQGALQTLAGAIPGYSGYQQKELRREADKLLRTYTADRLAEQQKRVTDIQATLARTGQLAAVGNIERLNAKFVLLIDSIRTASRGYAGWFDAVTINEADLDAIYDFDASLADGVTKITAAVDALKAAASARADVPTAVDNTAAAIEDMTERFKHRQEYVIEGKRAQAQFPTDVLKDKPKTTPEMIMLWNLRTKDAVTVTGTDYIVEGRVATSKAKSDWRRYLLKDGSNVQWLWIGDAGAALAMLQETATPDGAIDKPVVTVEGTEYKLDFESAEQVDVEGSSGRSSGNYVRVRRFQTDTGNILWLESWGSDTKALLGKSIPPGDVKVWSKK